MPRVTSTQSSPESAVPQSGPPMNNRRGTSLRLWHCRWPHANGKPFLATSPNRGPVCSRPSATSLAWSPTATPRFGPRGTPGSPRSDSRCPPVSPHGTLGARQPVAPETGSSSFPRPCDPADRGRLTADPMGQTCLYLLPLLPLPSSIPRLLSAAIPAIPGLRRGLRSPRIGLRNALAVAAWC
jgi:hypothetical protein